MDARQLEIQFRHLPPSDAIKEAVRRFANKLNGLSCRVDRCSVRLASELSEPLCGGPYFVHVEVAMQGLELAADQASDVDVHVALLNAFRDMQDMISAARSQSRCGERPSDARMAAAGSRQGRDRSERLDSARR